MIKLGILGMSEGNGHPYSWAAICNGYNQEYMKDCPFPVIPKYLAGQPFPEAAISGASVTHIWTQDEISSAHIAKASKIPHVVSQAEDMIGKVDAVLLARDDAENHYVMARPFIEAGLPIYIDKPLAYTVAEAEKIFSLQQYPGQVFSCSALKFSHEMRLSRFCGEKIGKISFIKGFVPKSWKKYMIHVIDPLVANFLSEEVLLTWTKKVNTTFTQVNYEFASGLKCCLIASGKAEGNIEIQLYGENDCKTLLFKDVFYAFKQALLAFLDSIEKKICVQQQVIDSIFMLEKGV